jgi:hypothetical protein
VFVYLVVLFVLLSCCCCSFFFIIFLLPGLLVASIFVVEEIIKILLLRCNKLLEAFCKKEKQGRNACPFRSFLAWYEGLILILHEYRVPTVCRLLLVSPVSFKSQSCVLCVEDKIKSNSVLKKSSSINLLFKKNKNNTMYLSYIYTYMYKLYKNIILHQN